MKSFFSTTPPKDKLRIISWNVRYGNKHVRELISHAIALDPDILCLQELQSELIPWIRSTYPRYFVYGCLEVSHTDPDKQHFICTVLKTPADEVSVINYDQKFRRSFYEKIFFGNLHHWTERHAALVVTVPFFTGHLRIVNVHLSAAVSAQERIKGFRFVLQRLSNLPVPSIFCGDFNIIDSIFFRLGMGWMLNYKSGDYMSSERRTFDLMFLRYGLNNIFRQMSTYMIPWHGWQLDHILVSDYVKVIRYIVGKKRFASDHRMILSEIAE